MASSGIGSALEIAAVAVVGFIALEVLGSIGGGPAGQPGLLGQAARGFGQTAGAVAAFGVGQALGARSTRQAITRQLQFTPVTPVPPVAPSYSPIQSLRQRAIAAVERIIRAVRRGGAPSISEVEVANAAVRSGAITVEELAAAAGTTVEELLPLLSLA
jgi:hypothetical protein